METINFNTSEMSDEKLDKAIETCKKYAGLYSSNPDKSKRYVETHKKLIAAKSKLQDAIEKTKKIPVKVKTGDVEEEMSFYDAYVKGKETTISVNWIGAQLKLHSAEMAESPEIDLKMPEVAQEKYDFFDATKHVASDFINGKGSSNGIAKKCIMIGAAELATKGISSYLVGAGALTESFGLVGLAKHLVANFPNYMASIGTGMKALLGYSPVIAIVGGVFVAQKLIPKVKHFIDKKTKEVKNISAGDNALDKLASETVSAGK